MNEGRKEGRMAGRMDGWKESRKDGMQEGRKGTRKQRQQGGSKHGSKKGAGVADKTVGIGSGDRGRGGRKEANTTTRKEGRKAARRAGVADRPWGLDPASARRASRAWKHE